MVPKKRPSPKVFAECLERDDQHEERFFIIEEASSFGKKCLVDLSHNVCVPLATRKTVPGMIRQLEVRSRAAPFTTQKLFPETGHLVWEPKPLPLLNPTGAKGPKKKQVANK